MYVVRRTQVMVLGLNSTVDQGMARVGRTRWREPKFFSAIRPHLRRLRNFVFSTKILVGNTCGVAEFCLFINYLIEVFSIRTWNTLSPLCWYHHIIPGTEVYEGIWKIFGARTFHDYIYLVPFKWSHRRRNSPLWYQNTKHNINLGIWILLNEKDLA